MNLLFTDRCYKNADHYWPLDKSVAGTVYDLIGLKHGKVAVEPASSRGPIYQGMQMRAMKLNSAQGKSIDLGDFYGDCIADAEVCHRGITIGFWVYIEDGKDSNILHTAERGNDRGMTIFYETSTSLLTARIYSTYEYGQVSVHIASQTHYHVFVSWERGQKPLLVVNGVEQFWGTRVSATRLEEKYSHLLAGVSPEGGESDARLSHVVIWKRALDSYELRAAFHCFGLQPGGVFFCSLNRLFVCLISYVCSIVYIVVCFHVLILIYLRI